MYVVVNKQDKSKSKVLPGFLIKPLIQDAKRKGKFLEVRTKNLDLLIKPYTIK